MDMSQPRIAVARAALANTTRFSSICCHYQLVLAPLLFFYKYIYSLLAFNSRIIESFIRNGEALLPRVVMAVVHFVIGRDSYLRVSTAALLIFIRALYCVVVL